MAFIEKTISQSICRLLEDGESFVLATILSRVGSTPRTSGAKMLVRRDERIIGTIGGGLVEAEVIKTAVGMYRNGQTRYGIRKFDLSAGGTADSMDMICGGRMEVLFEMIEPTSLNLEIFTNQRDGLAAGERNLMVMALPAAGSKSSGVGRCLISPDGSVIGNCMIKTAVLLEIWDRAHKERSPALMTIGGRRYVAEPVVTLGTVFIFGAGHVSREVAMLTTRVGFRTVVFDDREAYANRRRFGFVDDVRVARGYRDLFSDIEVNDDTCVVIVTRGHRYDKTVLAQALATAAGYIGMIGSKIKRDAIYAALLESGFTREDLARVYSPIGLPIGAETPEEIAISIVSELIRVRAKRIQA